MAWLPWAMDLKGWASFGAWAFLLSSGDPLGMLLAALAACFRRGNRAFVLAALSTAVVLFPTLEALALTHPSEGGWPDLDPQRERRIAALSREFRVKPEGLPLPAFPRPSLLNWVGGSRRPLGDFAKGDGSGVRLLLRGDGEEILRSPFRVGMQNEGSWTLLQPLYGPMGEMELNLPAGHAAGRLVISNAYYPGWSASVDAKARKVSKAEGGFQALALNASDAKVELKFRPMSWIFGLCVSMLGLFFTLLLLTSMREIPIISRFS
jgi:hypothetical protein